jgi:uncharacterized protein (TIGR02466 family)
LNAPEITLSYASPVLRHDLDDTHAVNTRLKAIILERAASVASVGKSNVGGWHSETDFFDWNHPEVGQLLQSVAKAVKAMMAAMTGVPELKGELDVWGWANVLYDGGYNQPHMHPESMWSGVYYVDTGEATAGVPNNGVIEFLDPRTAVDQVKMPGLPFSGRMRVEPRAGTLLLFPGWLSHYVNQYRGASPRIAVAFNVRIVDSNMPDNVSGGAIQFPLTPRTG